MDVKDVVNSLISDITNDASISKILLKAQVIAFYLNDKQFSQLIKNEQQGYSANDDIPDYRKQKSMIKATFLDCYQNTQTVEVHAIEDSQIRELMTFVYVKDALIQIETMYKNTANNMVRIQVPVFAYPTIKKLYVNNGLEVYSAYHYFPKEALLTIVETFKAQLLDLLLQLDMKLDWKLEISAENNKTVAQSIIKNVYNIHAVVANAGNGTIDTNDISLNKQ